MNGGGHCHSFVDMYNLLLLLLGCVCHECMSVVCAFVTHVSVYMLLCMHCYGHDFYACGYGMQLVFSCMISMYCYDYDYTCFMLIWLIL